MSQLGNSPVSNWSPKQLAAGIKKFIPRKKKSAVDINFVNANYTLKTASTLKEKRKAYRLRYDIFYKEFSSTSRSEPGIDKDRFDDVCDSLVIIDNQNERIVGTYRLAPHQGISWLYSATEFDLRSFLGYCPGPIVEVSRACIHPDYRTGTVISLLWRGIYHYMQAVDCRFLIGCSSITRMPDTQILSFIYHLQHSGLAFTGCPVRPLPAYDRSDDLLEQLGTTSVESFDPRALPALVRAYIKVGARFAPIPAYDSHFSCYDFFTIFDIHSMGRSMRARLDRNKRS